MNHLQAKELNSLNIVELNECDASNPMSFLYDDLTAFNIPTATTNSNVFAANNYQINRLEFNESINDTDTTETVKVGWDQKQARSIFDNPVQRHVPYIGFNAPALARQPSHDTKTNAFHQCHKHKYSQGELDYMEKDHVNSYKTDMNYLDSNTEQSLIKGQSNEKDVRKRLKHQVTDRKRRAKIKESMDALKDLIPLVPNQKSDQATVVATSVEFVRELKNEVVQLRSKIKACNLAAFNTFSSASSGEFMNKSPLSPADNQIVPMNHVF